MDPFVTEDFRSYHVTPTTNPDIPNSTDLPSLGLYNSTQTAEWLSDESVEISPTLTIILWLYFVVRILWGILAMFGNGLTILVVAKYERLQTCTNYLICSLAASDTVAGVVVPFMIVNELYPNSRIFIPACLSEQALSILSTGGNMTMILYLSIDRYIYISKPLRYHTLVTPQRTFLTLIFTWTFNLTSLPAIIFFLNHLEVGMPCKYNIFLDTWVKTYYLFPQFIILVVLTIWFNLAIAKIAHRQARAIAVQQQPYQTIEMAISQSTKKISRTLGMVLGVYLLSIIPQAIMASLIQTREYLLPFEKCTVILYWANAWVNPLIYVWRLKDFKIAFRKLLTGTGSFNEVV